MAPPGCPAVSTSNPLTSEVVCPIPAAPPGTGSCRPSPVSCLELAPEEVEQCEVVEAGEAGGYLAVEVVDGEVERLEAGEGVELRRYLPGELSILRSQGRAC